MKTIELIKIQKLKHKLNKKENKVIPDIEYMSKNVLIVNKQKKRQKLKLNSIQIAIDKKIDELREKGIPPRIIVLKARQEGVTTYSQGKMISQACQNKDMNWRIVSHEKDSTSAIFSKTKFMYDNLDDDIKPLQRASNARELVLDKPRHYDGKNEGLNSKIVVKIAGKETIGRGDTYSFVHMSEFAFWSGSGDNNPSSQLTAIMQAIPETLDSLAIIESTAKGYNDFKDTWDKAVNGENGWTPLFFSWFENEEYKKEFENEEQKKEFEKSLDEYELQIRKECNLSLEQINWYRYTKKVKCNNNKNKMKQENPTFPEEAFIFSGTPIFDNDLIMSRINFLERRLNQLIIGEFKYFNSTDGLTITEFEICEKPKESFYIKIYQKPKLGYPYTIGGDTKGEGKDFYAATVINCITQEVAAVLKTSLSDSKKYTEQLYCLGMYYNYALIGIEINLNTAPIERLIDLKYFRMYQREKKDDFTGKLQNKYGWKTDGITRPLMIDNHKAFTNEHIETFNDIETLREMLTFVEDEKGRPDAMAGKHDDLLISHMIAREIQTQTTRRIDVDSNKRLENLEFKEFDKNKGNKIKELWEKWNDEFEHN